MLFCDWFRLGFSLRNMAKIKVRQPLAELKVQPAIDLMETPMAEPSFDLPTKSKKS